MTLHSHYDGVITTQYQSIYIKFICIKGGLEQLHPEGPNIGYNSNSSWFDNKQTSDSDNILSQTKGTYRLIATNTETVTHLVIH